MLKSPLNYTGGKYRLLPQLLPIFPPESGINRFFDLFCGGFNVGINYHNSIIAIDNSKQLIQLLKHFQEHSTCAVLLQLEQIISKYKLSIDNEEGYYQLRSEYNREKNDPMLLYALMVHSFNHQIRFNFKRKEFNMPFGKGKSYFNSAIKKNLISFIETMHTKDIDFQCCDFFEVQNFKEGDFIYCDPPYQITLACYNERNQWSEKSDQRLFNFLDEVNSSNAFFGLSNVIEHGGKTNVALKEWSKKYNVNKMLMNYKSCSHNKKKRISSEEVYITNYVHNNKETFKLTRCPHP